MHAAPAPPDNGNVDTRLVILTIIGLWVFYFMIVTLRTWVMDFPAQGELAMRRGIVSGIGIPITIVQWLAMRVFDRASLGVRIFTAAMIAMPCAILAGAENYYFFNVYNPEGLIDIDKVRPPAEYKPGPITEIADLAIYRYFLLMAWASLYLALGFSENVRVAERRAADFARAAQTAELRALRYQVNPHFLFNTLNSLSALVMRDRRVEAEAMIMNLSTFYRTSLSGDPSEDVPLSEEIALQRLYLDIEAVRFPERLRVEIDVPDALAKRRVPGLILQPLVENAVKHGVSRTSNPVTIAISATYSGGALRITVSDDGPGPGPSATSGGRDHGIGLANVRDRLQARFDGRATLEAGRGADGGWRATLVLPEETQ